MNFNSIARIHFEIVSCKIIMLLASFFCSTKKYDVLKSSIIPCSPLIQVGELCNEIRRK